MREEPRAAPARRGSRAALAAISAIGISVASLVLLVILIGVRGTTPGAFGPDSPLPTIAALVLLAGLIVGAVVGHVLGLIAYANPRVREGAESGRALAAASIVAGVLLLLTCVLLAVVAGSAFNAFV